MNTCLKTFRTNAIVFFYHQVRSNMGIMKKLLYLCVFVILFSSYSFAIDKIQIDNLRKIYNYAIVLKQIYGYSFEKTLCAIALAESSCRNGVVGDDGKSYGMFQIKYDTAMYVAKKRKLNGILKMSKSKLIHMLKTNIEFSIYVAYHYLVLLKKQRKKWRYVVSGYNGGWYNLKYVKKIVKYMKWIDKHKVVYGFTN